MSERTDEDAKGFLRLTKIQMHINPRIQTFLVQKIGVSGVSKYTSNEVSLVESADIDITREEFNQSKAESHYRYCFKIQVKNN